MARPARPLRALARRRNQARAARPCLTRHERTRRRGTDRPQARRHRTLGYLGRDSSPHRLLPGRIGDAAAVLRVPLVHGCPVARARRRAAAVAARLRDAAAARAVGEPARLGAARRGPRLAGRAGRDGPATASERTRALAPARAVGVRFRLAVRAPPAGLLREDSRGRRLQAVRDRVGADDAHARRPRPFI